MLAMAMLCARGLYFSFNMCIGAVYYSNVPYVNIDAIKHGCIINTHEFDSHIWCSNQVLCYVCVSSGCVCAAKVRRRGLLM